MKKLKLLLALGCIAVASMSAMTNIEATAGYVTIYAQSAFYEVDSRPYVSDLSANCSYTYTYGGSGNHYVKTSKISRHGVYMTESLNVTGGYVSYSANMDCYANGSWVDSILVKY